MPLLSFNPLVGMVAPETAVLRDAVAANWEAAFNEGDGGPTLDTEAATPAGQLVDSEASILAQVNADMLYMFSMLNPRTSEGVWQDAIGYIYFLTRKIAQPTLVTVTCTGLQGTAIPVGAQMQDDDGNRYECINAVTIPASGSVEAVFQNVEAGPVECPAGTLSSIVTVIPGWDSGVNLSAGVTGWNRESQADFEARRFASVAKNSHGAVDSLQGALWDVESVTDCRVLENPADSPAVKHGIAIPGHSVAICIYGGSDADIAETIYLKKDAGCGTTGNVTVSHASPQYAGASYSYQIVRPSVRDVRISVAIHRTETTPANVAERIKAAVVSDFNGQNADSGNARVSLASTVYASRFSVAVVKTAGVADLAGIEIGFAGEALGSSITIDGYTEPAITEEDVIVTEV